MEVERKQKVPERKLKKLSVRQRLERSQNEPRASYVGELLTKYKQRL